MVYRFSGFEVDPSVRELRRRGNRIPLPPQAFQLLHLLVESAGATLTREELIERIWGDCHLADANQSLNMAMRRLRDALDDSPNDSKLIQTIPKLGYRFLVDVERIEQERNGSPPGEIPAEAAPPPPAQTSPGRWRPFAALAAGVVVVAGVTGMLWSRFGSHGEAGAPGLVLVASLDDSTGEGDLAGAFEVLLEAELGRSELVQVVSPDRITDTLKLMRKPDENRPGFKDAMEIARRDQGIRAVAGGDLRKVGATYLISLKLSDPSTGGAIVSMAGEADRREKFTPLVRDFATAIRGRMGERPPRAGSELDRVTTDSLRALKLFSDAHIEGRRSKWGAAEVLFREAVKLDPEFASAHLFIA